MPARLQAGARYRRRFMLGERSCACGDERIVLFSDGDRVKTGQIHAFSRRRIRDHEVEVFGETQYYKTAHVIAKIREPGHECAGSTRIRQTKRPYHPGVLEPLGTILVYVYIYIKHE